MSGVNLTKPYRGEKASLVVMDDFHVMPPLSPEVTLEIQMEQFGMERVDGYLGEERQVWRDKRGNTMTLLCLNWPDERLYLMGVG